MAGMHTVLMPQLSRRRAVHNVIEKAPVPSYIRARLTRAYLALADATRPCRQTGPIRSVRGRATSSYCVLGMSHICITLLVSIQKLAISLGDETITSRVYTCSRLVSSVESLHSLAFVHRAPTRTHGSRCQSSEQALMPTYQTLLDARC
jgi:hypothetical protein